MATCGYICPICEGRGIKEDGSDCDWCVSTPKNEENAQEALEAWIKKVHEGPCCSDPPEENKES